MSNTMYAYLAAAVVIFIAGNYTGILLGRMMAEWRRAKVAMKHAWPFVYAGGFMLVVIIVIGGAYLKTMW